MTKRAQQRVNNLLPNGQPRWVRVYDNDETADRFTVIFTGRYTHKTGKLHFGLGMSADPFCPQGVGMHFSYPYQCDTLGKNGRPYEQWPPAIGRKCHLGKRIKFSDLPSRCQQLVMSDYCDLWDIPKTHDGKMQ